MFSRLVIAALVASAAAGVVPRNELASPTGPGPNNTIPVFQGHTWPLLDFDQAVAALHAKAKATPSAVSFLAGVPLPTGMAQAVSQGIQGIGDLTHAIEGGFASLVEKPEASSTEEMMAAAQKLAVEKTGKTAPPQHAIDAHAQAASSTCSSPQKFYEWRNLPNNDKSAWVACVAKMQKTPARSGLAGTKTRWDDLGALHQEQSNIIHNVGQFFAWHRYFMWILQQEMQHVCGYTGPQLWWDETKDAGHFSSSPLFTSQYFGPLNDGSAQCVSKGAFGGLELHIGPGSSNTNHCLSRAGNEKLSAAITSNFMNTCWSYNDFEDFQNCFFFGPHAYGHDAVGAVMSDVASSPGDPIFFAHHGMVNRAWWHWQMVNPLARVYAIGGYTTQNCGSHCQPTTLNYVLSSLNFYPSVQINDVMYTQGGFLCYTYDY